MPGQDWKEFLAKAKECLKSAQSAEGKKLNNCAANRAYYAAYLAELAALEKFDPVKATTIQHKNIVEAFNARLIQKKKLFDGSIITDVASLESIRVKADYKPDHVTATEARDCVKMAMRVVAAIEAELTKLKES